MDNYCWFGTIVMSDVETKVVILELCLSESSSWLRRGCSLSAASGGPKVRRLIFSLVPGAVLEQYNIIRLDIWERDHVGILEEHCKFEVKLYFTNSKLIHQIAQILVQALQSLRP